MILLALDLDNTLIHSYRRAAENDVCVETMETENGIKKLSFMSPDAYRKFTSLSSEIIAVPITTRSQAQFGRISLFGNGTPLAVTANGGDLLVNGVPDREWRSISEALISPSLGELKRGAELLENDKNRSFEVRFVDESFMFTKSENVPETMKMLSESLDMNIVTLHENGSKVYILPKGLDKGSCLERLKSRLMHTDEFPHEIGIFLGYPLDDVKGFIDNAGQNSKCTGCWKVYCNECEAIKTFAKFKTKETKKENDMFYYEQDVKNENLTEVFEDLEENSTEPQSDENKKENIGSVADESSEGTVDLNELAQGGEQ